MRRKWMLLPSFALAAAAYAALYFLLGDLPLLQARSQPLEILETFQVDLWEEPAPRAAEQAPAEDLSAPPSALPDLLARSMEPLPGDTVLEQRLPVPDLTDRVAAEQLERKHDLAREESAVRRADTRILEISEAAARRDIEISRRLVDPSPVRVLPPDELPTLRGESTISLTSNINPLFAPEVSEGAPVLDAIDPPSERPSFEWGILSPPMEPALPGLEIENLVARNPAREEILGDNRYEFMDDLLEIHLETYEAPGEPQGYFRLRIAPRQDREIPVLPKDVTFVIDASKSIIQRKLDLTVRGLQDCLRMLRNEDRFNVVIFRDTPTFFRPELVQATEDNRAAALQFLSNLESRGETDVFNGVAPVVAQPPRSGLPGVVMVISDGRPTAGVMDGRDIINRLTDANEHRTSVYAFGGGNTVNRYLMDLLAYRNKGSAHITEIEQMERDLPLFFGRLQDPILVDLDADYGRIDETAVYPKEIPDFYRGQVVTVYGRYSPRTEREFVMRLQGQAGTGHKEVIFQADLDESETGGPDIASNWAFQKIYALIGEMSRVGETPELLAEIRELSRRYNIKTVYTQ